jgi:predicted metal-dependent hydrolase
MDVTDSKIIQVEGIGAVLVEHSRRARRIVVSVRTGKGVRVAVPRGTPVEKALEFVKSKRRWINLQIGKVREYEKRKQTFNESFQSINKTEARKRIIGRLAELASQYGFTYKNVSIRNQRTRWGSCSAKRNISLNIKLVALPAGLCDYVILHELVHTRVHNHSGRFWQELDRCVGNAKAKAKALREYGVGIL